MSLINDALKKAQRQRSDDPLAPATPGAPVVKRDAPRSANSMLLFAGGGLAIAVIAVLVTLLLLKRSPEPAAPAVVATNKPAAAPASAGPATPTPAPASTNANPVTPALTSANSLALPPLELPAPAKSAALPPTETKPAPAGSLKAEAAPLSRSNRPEPAASGAPAVISPNAKIPAAPATTPLPAPSAQLATPPPTPAAVAREAEPDPRIHAFVDGLKITGVRPAGNDSRVLMSDRVFRVNDIVERTLGVRLIKVEADNVTFSDANGVIYVKYF
jgi:hypothetical protein